MYNFSNSYNRNNFVEFLENNFLPEDFQLKEEKLNLNFSPKFTSSATRLGVCKSLDLEIFEVEHNSTHDARVGIARDAFQIMHKNSYCNKALVAFIPKGSNQYRFSFLQIEAELKDLSARIRRNYSNPRRYSFLLGKGAQIKTPKQFLAKGRVKNTDDLIERFSIEALTKQFYRELFDWYLWALSENDGFTVTFPNETDIRKIEEHLIRLITRLMFVWFIKQKKLIPEDIFDTGALYSILKEFDPMSKSSGNYYNAILQNLFFATLNKPIEERAFASENFFQGKNEHYGIKTLFRDANEKTWFKKSHEEVIKLFQEVPFLNGGLFECLDKEDKDGKIYYYDGFSRAKGQKKRAFIPNCLFFDPEKGLISILNKYNFTVEENTPQDVEVALDPELLGKVFENLLGAYNPETKETARKQSGSFYTPREVVNYMVDESLIAYLAEKCPEVPENVIQSLFKEEDLPTELQNNPQSRIELSTKLKNAKILDPACGSGAFPMGILNRMVEVLKKLDVDGKENSYNLKLDLIENCIYGIDIQSIAIQISKLRFFISLICEQNPSKNIKENYGITALPNLETKFVSANTLVGLKKRDKQLNLFEDPEIEKTKQKLLEVRHKHFSAKNVKEKTKFRNEDKQLREKLSKLLEFNEMFSPEDAIQLAEWNPYDQNMSSPFFNPEWMFGLMDGFDVIIGNPPYISTKGISNVEKKLYETEFGFSDDTYNLFTFKGLMLSKDNGSLTYIIPKTFWTTQTKRNMRDLLLKNSIRYIFDTANPFESVMVDTCIVQVMAKPFDKNHMIRFLDGSKNLKEPIIFKPISQDAYRLAQNSVIFKPTEYNLKIYSLYGKKVKELYEQWWDKIETSKKIAQNAKELEEYRTNLKPGDLALLGCLTEGGQGLATANNGKYIAVRKSTKWAKNIIDSRPKKLAEAVKRYKITNNELDGLSPEDFLKNKSEQEIAIKFDQLKEKYGRDIFGQGYIFRLIDDEEIADVDLLTDDEKENGIDISKKYYVPYDKGDKDGNRWYLETPYAIAWSKENVRFLKTDPKARYQGYMFYFREGFCWIDVNSTFLKARLKDKGIFDVLSMSLFTMFHLPDWYYVCLINSNLISLYVDNFINNTSHFQINDARQLPIIIPSKIQLNEFESIFIEAENIKIEQFGSIISAIEADKCLIQIQKKLDKMVNKLYAI